MPSQPFLAIITPVGMSGHPEHPIVIPPPGPSHPIYPVPPEGPAHPIQPVPPWGPSHPIYPVPPLGPSHPIQPVPPIGPSHPIVLPLPPGTEPPEPGDGNSPAHPIYLPPEQPAGGNKVLVHVYVPGKGGTWFLVDMSGQPPPDQTPQPKPSY